MQDGNFSVVANFNKGSLVSVTITEPKESITLKNNGNVSLFLLSLNQFPIAAASYVGDVCDTNWEWGKWIGERETRKGGRMGGWNHQITLIRYSVYESYNAIPYWTL